MLIRNRLVLLQQAAESTTTTSPGSTGEAAPTPAPQASGAEDFGATASASDGDLNAGGEASVDWLAESETGGEGEGADPSPEPKPAPAAAQPTPTPPAPAQPAEAAVAAPATPAPVVTPQAPAATPATPAEPVAAKTPEQLEAERQAAITAAAEAQTKQFNGLVEYYKLPDDLAARIGTEPETVLPVLAAKVHQAIAMNFERTMQTVLPTLVRNVAAMDKSEAEARQQFLGRWPNLAAHEKEVFRIGAIYRQLNPNADASTAVERIGQLVHEALGIPLPQAPGAPGAATATTPATPARTAPFVPAGGNGGARGPAPGSDNEFESMAQDLLGSDELL